MKEFQVLVPAASPSLEDSVRSTSAHSKSPKERVRLGLIAPSILAGSAGTRAEMATVAEVRQPNGSANPCDTKDRRERERERTAMAGGIHAYKY